MCTIYLTMFYKSYVRSHLLLKKYGNSKYQLMFVRRSKKLSVIWKFNFYKVLEKVRKKINQSHHNKSGLEGIFVI